MAQPVVARDCSSSRAPMLPWASLWYSLSRMKASIGFLLAVSGFAATILAADLSQFKTADELWLHIRQMQQQGPSEQARTLEEHRAIVKNFIGQIDVALAEFCRRFPTDARRWDAKLTRVQYTNLLADLQGRPYDQAADEKTLKEIAAAADASTETKARASLFLMQFHAAPLLQSTNATAVAAVEAEITAFEKQYPQDPRNEQLRLLKARLFQKADPAKAESLMKTLAKSSDPQVAYEAQGYLTSLDISMKPVQLRFTAVDGSTVDLEKLRGKVVLLDFWATWCGPCRVQGKLVEQVAGSFRTDSTATFLSLNTDQDRSGVPAFLKNQGWTLPVAYAQGLDELLSVRALPTLVIFDCHGRVVFREDGVDPGSFVEEVSRHLRETLRELSPGPMPPS